MKEAKVNPQSAELPEGRLGHYLLGQEVGRGAVSTVYEAKDLNLGRTVALKVLELPRSLRPGREDERIARLKREARAMASLAHPNVVTIHELGEQDGVYYLVMEFLDGTTLRDRLNGGPIPPEEAAGILAQIAAGVDAVHRQGLLHRDIKPSNVMLLYSGQVKLLDFGVARAIDDTAMTQAGSMIGSPAYLAPEQLAEGTVTPASDIWALGVLLYEMLAGRPPFPAASVPGVMYKIAHTQPAPLPGVSPGVRDVLRRALEKNPARRYASAHALSDAFSTALKSGAVSSSVPAAASETAGNPDRTLRFAAPRPVSRRGRWPAVAAGLLCLAGLAALAGAMLRRLPPSSIPSGTTRVVLNPARSPRPRLFVRRVTPLPATPSASAQALSPVRRTRPARPPQMLAEAKRLLPQEPALGADDRLSSPSIQPEAIPPAPAKAMAPAPSVRFERPVMGRKPPVNRRQSDVSTSPATNRRAAALFNEAAPRSEESPLPRKMRSPAGPPQPPRQIVMAPEPESRQEASRPAEASGPASRAPARTWRYQEAAPETAAAPPAETPDAPSDARSPEGDGEEARAGDPEVDRAALTRQLRRWIAATNTRDIDAQMRFYSRRVHAFYLKRDVSRDDVRAEKERVFDNANVIDIHASDPVIYLSDDGREAVMRFRKRYTIAGWDRWRRGEVVQELVWRRTWQGWKITGERDLRVLADR